MFNKLKNIMAKATKKKSSKSVKSEKIVSEEKPEVVVAEEQPEVVAAEEQPVVVVEEQPKDAFSSGEIVSFSRNKHIFAEKIEIISKAEDGSYILQHNYGKVLDKETVSKYKLKENVAYIFATENELTKI